MSPRDWRLRIEEIAARYSHIPWTAMRGMRNILIHEYFLVSL